MDTGINKLELLQVADTVAREKGINAEEVIEAMELAIQKAGRTKYGHENDIRALIDRKSGDINLMRYREVVDEVENEATQITLEEAKKLNSEISLGEFIVDPLPPIDFGRVAAQTARQVIIQRVREAERDHSYEEFKDRVGEIINGVVKRIEMGNVILDLGRTEGFLRRDELIPRENLSTGDRTRAIIYEVRHETHGPQIMLSRTHPEFMTKLFTQEVPEIYDGIIEIKSVARDPGSRAKIAVATNDASIDPVGACVGMRGSRVQAVVNELHGEKIDIVPWSSNIATFMVNALAPAEVAKVVVEEDTNRIEVIVPDDQLSIAIGRRGQNVRLATQLTGWEIDITTETDANVKRQEETDARSKMFIDTLDVDEVISRLLVLEGFTQIEEIAYIELDELKSIEGFDESIAEELQNRARDYLEALEKSQQEKITKLGITPELSEIPGLSSEMLIELGKNGIRSLNDFADLASDEVLELLGKQGITEEEANDMIMAARAHWFEDEHSEPEEPEEVPTET